MRKLVIAVTGTPAAGKTSFAEALGRLVPGRKALEIVELNALVDRHKLYSGKDEYGSRIVKMRGLASAVKKAASSEGSSAIALIGHLAADLDLRYDISVVVRSPLKLLAERMEERGYAPGKIRENLVAEALDYCGEEISGKSEETYEVETASQKRAALKYLSMRIKGKKPPRPRLPPIDRFRDLGAMIAAGNRYKL